MEVSPLFPCVPPFSTHWNSKSQQKNRSGALAIVVHRSTSISAFLAMWLVIGMLNLLLSTLAFRIPLSLRDARLSPSSLDTASNAENMNGELKQLLGNSNLMVTYDGFNDVENMTCIISLSKNSEVDFSGGIQAFKKGFWRVYNSDSSNALWTVEMSHFVLPEYILFFDIWEPVILWKGQVDIASKQIINGQVLSRTKILGLFPYTKTIATFRARILVEGEAVPYVAVPKLSDQVFVVSQSCLVLINALDDALTLWSDRYLMDSKILVICLSFHTYLLLNFRSIGSLWRYSSSSPS
jgi:hypothetical protein